ncbi:MAG: o-succinylbenzoate--CoA ligase, partial [Candidatus Zixiibacteriota bacterium]
MAKVRCPLATAAGNFGDQTALADENHLLTYRELDRQVSHVTGLLRTEGISAGDRIAIAERNSFEFVLTLLALWRLGAIACPLNTRYPTSALTQQAERIDCKYQIRCSPGDSQHLLPSLNQIELDLSSDQPCNDAPGNNLIEFDQPATIIHTSGSTNTPKAVLHSFGNHYYSALGSNKNIPVGPGDRWLLSLPLYHVGGLGILFRCLLGGGTIVMASQADSLLVQIAEHNITHLSLVTTQLRRLLDELRKHTGKPIGLKAILLGGSSIPSGLVNEAQLSGLPIFRSYGLTEMASQVATSTANDPSRPAVLDHRQLKISDNDEILVKGNTLFLG